MSTPDWTPPTDDRLRELATDICDEQIVLGSLDIEDIRAALLELVAWRQRSPGVQP